MCQQCYADISKRTLKCFQVPARSLLEIMFAVDTLIGPLKNKVPRKKFQVYPQTV